MPSIAQRRTASSSVLFSRQYDAARDNLRARRFSLALSHDIIARGTTHAIVDGIRKYFTEPTNIDVPAFHRGVRGSSTARAFRHFAHKEVLPDTLQKTGGELYPEYLKPKADIGESDSGKSGKSSKRRSRLRIRWFNWHSSLGRRSDCAPDCVGARHAR